jgi:hypothetical protein
LIYTGITTNDNLQTALQKIDQKFQDAGLGYIFSNGIEQLTPGGAVMLGGALNKNTTIGGLYTLAFAGTLEASALVTTGGTSSQFVKGDGSLDSTSYQPSGNYISNLTGDVTANGPGSVTATLATVFGAPGTYGNSGNVPSITVDGKGRITNVTPIPINYPAQSLSFVGDVDGFGFTGSPVTLTLDTVNTDIYGSNNFLKFAVNGKGLITSATPVSGGDITTTLGYVPVNDAIELTINGVAHDLTANRSWSVGTVTSVGVTAGLGISASVSNPNTIPVINIVNTAPDQTVNLNAGYGISISGSYPNFTITNDYPDIPGGGGVTSFSAGNLSPLFNTSVTNPTTTPALSFALANAAANTVLAGPNGGAGAPTYRALVAADIPSLAYISSISVSAPLASTGGSTPTLSISQANASTDGYLSSTDWNTFNGKQSAGNYITALTGDGTASGPGSACFTLNTVNSDVFTSETLLNIAVNGKGLITSANPTTSGDICSTLGYTPENVANKSTCTSLGTSNTLYPTQLAVKTYIDNATAGGIILQGDWNAATNTPDISGTTNTGWAWRVSVQGTTNLGGINDWHVGDLAVKSATGWVKIDNTENVTSVFGRFGTVIATTGDYLTCQVTECGNLYYTDARVRAAVGHTAPLTYNSTTGVFGITQSNTTTDGYLSATDWNTFNNKQPALGFTPVNQTRQLTINGTTYDLSADRSWSVGTVTSVTASAPLSSTCGTAPNLTITQSGIASDGYLSSADWNTFNSKTSCLGTVTNVATCSSTTGVTLSGSPITSSGTLGVDISTASATCTGLLSSADWNTFNSHTGCTGTVTCVAATGTNISVTGSPITTSGTLAISLSGGNVCSALGYTPYDASNPNGYTTCIGTVTSVGVVATNINVCNSPVTTNGNICLNLTAANVCSALGFSPTTGTGVSGQVTYFNGTSSVAGSNNHFWDASNNRLGIGLVNPQRALEIYSTTADSHLRLSGSAPSVSLGEAITGSIYQAKFGLATANGQYAPGAVAGDFVIISQTAGILFNTNSNTLALKLAGTGAATFSSSVTIQGGNALYVNNAANTRVGSLATTGDGTELSSHNGSGEPLYLKAPHTTANIIFVTNGTNTTGERMRILANGNVGIGTSSPGRKLDVNGVTRSNAFDIYYNSVTSGFLLTETQWTGVAGANNVSLVAEGGVTGGGNITFFTNGSATERMRITSGGQVLIGQTAASGSSNGIYFRPGIESGFIVTSDVALQLSRLVTTGDIQTFYSGTTRVGKIAVGSSTVTFESANNGGLSIASTGAATFSSSVTATSGTFITGSQNSTGVYIGANNSWTSGSEARLDFGGLSGNLGRVATYYSGSGLLWGMKFYTTNSSLNATPALTLTGDNNVGIGTTSPSTKLHVSGTAANTVAYVSDTTGYALYQLGNTGGGLYLGIDSSTASGFGNGAYSRHLYSTGAYPLIISTNDTERMRIQSDGIIKLSTTGTITSDNNTILSYSPNGYLYIQGGSTGLALAGSGNRNNAIYINSSLNSILFHLGDGTEKARITSSGSLGLGGINNPQTQLQLNGTITFSEAGYDTVRLNQIASQHSDGSSPNNFIRFLVSNGSGVTSERMRINGDGNLLIGTTSNAGNYKLVATNVYAKQFLALGVNDDGRYIGQGDFISGAFQSYDLTIVNYASSGRVTITNGTTGVYLANGATSWSTFSDERLKNINSPIENAVEKLSKIRAVNYSWKSDKNNKEILGLIAQDVEKIFPQIIDKSKGFIENDETEYLSVKYTELIPVLIKAIQELNDKIK